MERREKTERAVLVGAGRDRHVDELGRLATTLGAGVVGVVEQNRMDRVGYAGKGKRLEVRDIVHSARAGLVIADDELTASQARVLERDVGASVVDRTELIIRIFEAHAKDRASRLQVELADLEYRLPRVKGRNEALSRLGGGGVTTRGPGEQQLEYDRRAIRKRMGTIARKLDEERTSRSVRTRRLREGPTPSVALVGYTNAGKTTILNALTGASRSTRDWLFETLETTTRLAEGDGSSMPDFVVTDTVGFIRKLPTQLIHSFSSTLEAARGADVKVLCADAGSPDLESEVETVISTLRETLGVDEIEDRLMICFNKVDLASEDRLKDLRLKYPGAAFISALEDCTPLLGAIYREISSRGERLELLIPHSEYAAASRLYGLAEIHSSKSTNEGVWMDVTLPSPEARKYDPYQVA